MLRTHGSSSLAGSVITSDILLEQYIHIVFISIFYYSTVHCKLITCILLTRNGTKAKSNFIFRNSVVYTAHIDVRHSETDVAATV